MLCQVAVCRLLIGIKASHILEIRFQDLSRRPDTPNPQLDVHLQTLNLNPIMTRFHTDKADQINSNANLKGKRHLANNGALSEEEISVSADPNFHNGSKDGYDHGHGHDRNHSQGDGYFDIDIESDREMTMSVEPLPSRPRFGWWLRPRRSGALRVNVNTKCYGTDPETWDGMGTCPGASTSAGPSTGGLKVSRLGRFDDWL